MKSPKYYKRWTEQDHKFIKDNYQSMSNEQLAAKLGRTRAAIANQRVKLGLDNWDYSQRSTGRKSDEDNDSYGRGFLGTAKAIQKMFEIPLKR